jgi:hypothetical protein
MSKLKVYNVVPRAGSRERPMLVAGFREAIGVARKIAERDHCAVTVRNEIDCHTWTVAFRVRSGRRGGARCGVEVTR